jgi:predicted transcriptional regulator
MPSFKEWLVLESIRTDIIAPIYTNMITEAVLEEFLRLFFEETQECEHCGYVGEFEEKDDENVCPKCGKPEEVKIADPFADGDEDAKPVEIDQDAIDSDRKEAERARAEAEAEEARRNAKTKDKDDPSHLSDSQREFAIRLKNNALWIRWHSMTERKRDIERLKEIAAAHKDEINSISEGFGLFDDEDEAPAEKQNVPDLDEAKEILIRLGYLKPERIELAKTDEKRRRSILKAMKLAVEEKGNDVPEDVDASELMEPVKDKDGNPELDRWGRPKMRPSQTVEKAKSQLVSDLSGLDDNSPDVFRRAFRSVVAGNQGTFRGAQKDKTTGKPILGHKFYSDPEEVANEFVTKMINMLTTRKVTSEGKAKSWRTMHSGHPDLGSSGKKDLSSDEAIGSILASWRQRIFRLAQEAEHDQRLRLAPTAHRPDEVKRRSEVNSRMNKDIKAAKTALYAKSMIEGGLSEEEVAERIGTTKAEVENMVRDPYASLRFHINYLNAVRQGNEESIRASGDDKQRLELMKQIVLRSSSQRGISLDPENIIQSLETYRDNYSTKGRAKPIFAGQAGDDDSGDELSQGLDTLARIRSDDEAPEKGGVFSGSSVNATPAAEAMAKERKRKMLQYLYEALKAMNNMGATSKKPENRRTEYWQTLAVCIKLGLPYDNATGNWMSVDIDDELVDKFFAQSAQTSGDKCFQQLSAIGNVSLDEMHRKLREIAIRLHGPDKPPKGGDISYARSWQWLGDGLKFICDYLKKRKMPQF